MPARDVQVLAVDADVGLDDPLGIDTTLLDGRFETTAEREDFDDALEGQPEIYLYVFNEGQLAEQRQIEAPETTGIEITIDRTAATPDLDPEEMMEAAESMHHGMTESRGIQNVPRGPAYPGRGRFGRMFPNLRAARHDIDFLQELGLPGNLLDESEAGSVGESSVPAGFVFLGQFIDHDITLDPLSSLSRQNDPDALRNFRTPRLDLDSVYGSGPEVDRFRYESPFVGGDSDYFLLAEADRIDVPRNHHDTALIADPRNDENLIISQLQYAMLNFHNAVVDRMDKSPERFEKAQQRVRRHWQWIVLHEYLPTVCDEDIVASVRDDGDRRFFTVGPDDEAYMPLEFAVAAYRFGHSQARLNYRVNKGFEGALFGPPRSPDALGMGFEPVPEHKAVNWRFLFEFGDTDITPQKARKIDQRLSRDLLDLPFVMSDTDWERSLASRNLVRGRRLGLPSGQAVARRIEDAPVLTNEMIGFDEALDDHYDDETPEETEAPLWYYVLAEAAHLNDGEHLGPVGSRIVAEVLVGLIDSDASSYRTVYPDWTPTLPNKHSGGDDFRMADLLELAVDGGYVSPGH